MASEIWVNIDSGNGLLPDGTKRVSAGVKRQRNNTVGTAAAHPDDQLPTERRTHEKNIEKRWIFTLCTTAPLGINVRE